MADLASLVDSDGRVDGHQLLRWLRSRAGVARSRQAEAYELQQDVQDIYHRARAELLEAMADDLERLGRPEQERVDQTF